ncbi:hypothetical protein RRG08_018450 [Elysia crispata]|uniref:Uncharacterized protein n=1 Tax=Elysia crispata TaxID=231223 RepID=A0AAE0YTW9_9GAST|nr:hypothetical protein RRG08_018450 [Elysia crispata]
MPQDYSSTANKQLVKLQMDLDEVLNNRRKVRQRDRPGGGSEGKSDEGFHNKTNIETHCNIVNLRGCDPGPAGQFSVETQRQLDLGSFRVADCCHENYRWRPTASLVSAAGSATSARSVPGPCQACDSVTPHLPWSGGGFIGRIKPDLSE